MPILDTVVLFGCADSKDRHHERAVKHLQTISESTTYLATLALMEFDVVLKSRGIGFENRMMKHAALIRDYPNIEDKVAGLTPSTFYLAAKLEDEAGLEYFDAGIAAEALQLDGKIISTDKAFDNVEGLKRIW